MVIIDDACGRYTLHKAAERLAERYNLAELPQGIHDSYNVAPGQFMPVITEDENGKHHLEIMKWGLIPSWSKDPNIGYKLINARDDNLFKSPIWRSVILKRRALIPADGFYEWQKPSSPKERKKPFYIRPKQIDIFSFAGVWEAWKDSDNNEWKTYSIVTTEPNEEISSVHNRMPAILQQEDEASWLKPSKVTRDDVEPLLRPFDDNELEMYEVSSDVNATQHNDAKLILPMNAQ
jgi:putative SOS response-associated peptidase YedK